MIDKKKLIEKFKELELPHSASIIENFPEEPEIDIDALFEEYLSVQKTATTFNFCDFLKSKHLSAPQVDMDQLRNEVYSQVVNQKQLPVKKVWTLKKDILDFVETVVPNLTIVTQCDTEPSYAQYYDLTETPDYSQVNVGDVVEIVTIVGGDERKYYGTRTNHINENYFYLSVNNELPSTGIKFKDIKSLTILKAAE